MSKTYRNETHETYHHNIGVLIKHFPEVFCKEKPLPLKVGTFDDIKAFNLIPDKVLDQVLKVWTVRWEYQVAKVMYKGRFDIFGKLAGEISDADRMSAQKLINSYARRTATKVFHQYGYIAHNENPKFLRSK